MSLEIAKRSYQTIKSFQTLFCDYTQSEPNLLPFVSAFFTEASVKQQIEAKRKNYPDKVRELLVNKISNQYQALALSDKQAQNLEWLKDNKTFSVSCGHQLNLAGGPVYVAYKLLTTIKLAEHLNAQFPEYRFVPIHWLASEDHDLEEVSVLNFFSTKTKVEINQTGPVGKMSTTGIADQLLQIRDFPEWMANAYNQGKDLTESTRIWIQEAFGKYGILTLDSNDADLKSVFSQALLEELSAPWVEKAVVSKTDELEKLGYKAQIHPRAINLFLMGNSRRVRLEHEDGILKSIDGRFSMPKAKAIDYFKEHPEKLSPNVALRPLFSQVLLPDIAFVGGPAELSYWMQLGSVFQKYEIEFPLLVPRFSALYVSKGQGSKMKKLNLDHSDLFKEAHEIKRNLVRSEWERPDLENIYSNLFNWSEAVDPTLTPSLKAEISKMEKMVDQLEKKIEKAAEQKNELQINQINGLLSKLFPGGNLQERHESWISFLVGNPGWISEIYEAIDPLDFSFKILTEAS